MATFTIAVLPGDGIGPEVVSQGVKVLESIGARFRHRFQLKYDLIGGSAIDRCGVRRLDAALFIGPDRGGGGGGVGH